VGAGDVPIKAHGNAVENWAHVTARCGRQPLPNDWLGSAGLGLPAFSIAFNQLGDPL
jgi:hypothetical protein